MGTYARGKVFWGYDLGDMTNDDFESTAPAWLVNDDDDGETGREWEDELAVRLGWDEIPFPEHLDFDWGTRSHEQTPDYKAYRASRARRDEILAASRLGVEIGYYGHTDGEQCRYVAITGTTVTATYECIRLSDTSGFQPDWPDRMRRFMELLDLPIPAVDPGWYVTSSYG